MSDAAQAMAHWPGGPAEMQRWLAAVLLVSLRLLPLVAISIPLGRGTAANALRLALAAVLAAALAPRALSGPATLPGDGYGLLLLGIRELLVGAVFAVAVALPFFALRWAGELTDLWRGSFFDQALQADERPSPLGALYLMASLAFFFSLGGHRVAVEAFARTLDSVPVGHALSATGLGQAALGGARLLGNAMALSAALCAPVAAALVLVELVLGLVGRAAPQIPLFFLAMPLRAALGLGAALLAMSFLFADLGDLFLHAIGSASRLVEALGP